MAVRIVLCTTVLAAGVALASAAAQAAPNPQIAGVQVALRAKHLYLGSIDAIACQALPAMRCRS